MIRFDVVGLGNAIVDILAPCEDAFLDAQGIAKGAMTLIDEVRAQALYDHMKPAQERSGGSAANTVAGLASFGAQTAYLGKVADDQLGDVFAHDLRAANVTFQTARLSGGPETARSYILVSPDAQRSMNTFLGASTEFSEADVDAEIIQAGQILYLEGYLFDKPAAKAAYVRASELAKAANRKVSLTLSDPFCVDRHRDAFRHLVAHHIDILFANEAELLSLYETEDLDSAVAAVRRDTAIVAVTRSEKGSLVITDREIVEIPAVAVAKVVDTTGAGDQYAAGALFGLAQGFEPETCGRLGALAASEVISHYGARPEVSLAEHARAHGLL
ncbi:MAG: adenosine kinase [Maricaulaceae bacterium]